MVQAVNTLRSRQNRDISQTTFSNAFSGMKFSLRFHWSLFLRFELTIFQHWSAPSHFLNQWMLVYWRHICVTRPRWFETPPSLKTMSCLTWQFHYSDVIMATIASQITSLTIVYSTVYSGADQRKHQSSASLAFVWGSHRVPVNSRGECFHLMTSSCFSITVPQGAMHDIDSFIPEYFFLISHQWPLLLTKINFNPGMDK